jgi:hypothetical protein
VEGVKKEPLAVQISLSKWKWNGCTLKKDSFAIEKQTLTWNPQGQCTGRRLRRSWRRMIEEEARIVQETCRQVRAVDANKVHWPCFIEAICSTVK